MFPSKRVTVTAYEGLDGQSGKRVGTATVEGVTYARVLLDGDGHDRLVPPGNLRPGGRRWLRIGTFSEVSTGRTRTGYGWSCQPCRIIAGQPDDAFASEQEAKAGLDKHLADSHGGANPGGAAADEFTWRD